jgi:two-component system OmpR family response regulator
LIARPAKAREMQELCHMQARVLVADDDPDLLDIVVTSLTESGADVVSATSGADLLEHLADDGPFDLIITDVAMPWMTGFQVAHSVREAGLDVPVIIMTGRDDPGLTERVQSLGGRAALLRKPFDSQALDAAVAALLA